MKRIDWRSWLRGLVAAIIGGFAHGITASIATIGIDPDHFNLTVGFHKVILEFWVCGTISGIITAAAFLQKSPIPDEVEVTAEIQPGSLITPLERRATPREEKLPNATP